MKLYALIVLALTACASPKALDAVDAPSPSVDVVKASDGTPDAALDAPIVPAHKKLLRLRGQSNANGKGLTSDLATIDPTLAMPLASVQYVSITGNDANPPVTVSYPAAPLGPRLDIAGVDRFGVELSLGRALDAANPGQWVIMKDALDSTSIAGEWWPEGVYPTIPAGTPNWFTQSVTLTKQVEADTGSDLVVDVWMQGESDATNVANATLYARRMAMFIGADRFEIPTPRPFIFTRLNINNAGIGTPQERASQEANVRPDVIMVDTDALGLQSDHAHFTSASLVALGYAIAQTVLQAVGP